MSKLMSVLGIVLLAIGAALALVGLVNSAQMQIYGLTMDTAAILLTGGILSIGLGGVISALQGYVPAATTAPVVEETIPVIERPVFKPVATEVPVVEAPAAASVKNNLPASDSRALAAKLLTWQSPLLRLQLLLQSPGVKQSPLRQKVRWKIQLQLLIKLKPTSPMPSAAFPTSQIRRLKTVLKKLTKTKLLPKTTKSPPTANFM